MVPNEARWSGAQEARQRRRPEPVLQYGMAFKPPKPEKISLDGPAGRLEAILEQPEAAPTRAVAVVCHPHPLYQGTMHNKVVHTIARGLHELDVVTVRFNYRGVGDSEGIYDDGAGETEDALSALTWMRERWPDSPVCLAGFSFGAWIALKVATRTPDVRQLVTVAPPVERIATDVHEYPSCPWLIIQGSDDELVDCDAVISWVNQLPPGPELAVLDGVDHFFHARLNDLKHTILENALRIPPEGDED